MHDLINNIENEKNYSKGLIKEYNEYGDLKYAGYLNEKRNGKGKEYRDICELIFEGEYLYNFKLKGKLYRNKRLEYEG